MKKRMQRIAFVVCIALLFATAQNVLAGRRGICIGGIYDGIHIDTASRSCPSPNKGKFEFQIKQRMDCDKKLGGQVVDPDGGVFIFKGSVISSTSRTNVTIGGELTKPGDTIKIKATLTKFGTKWQTKNGQYSNPSDCSGIFKMKQR